MRVRIHRYESIPSQPWKNGLGLTRPLAIHPPLATADSFEWRLSIAQLTGTAPFSSFPGIMRSLAVLEGVLSLRWESGEVQHLNPSSAPVEFPGDAPVSGSVEGAPALDLNLMWQPTRWHAVMTRLTANEGARQLDRFMGICMVCSLVPHLPLQVAGAQHVLGRYDLLWFEDPEARLAALEVSGFDAYCIELQPR